MSYLIGSLNKDSRIHVNKGYEIIVYISGSATFHTDEKDIKVSAGKMIIMPPGLNHASTVDGEAERIYIGGDFNHIFTFAQPVFITDTPEGEGVSLAKMIYRNRFSSTEFVSSLVNSLSHFLLQNLKTEEDINAKIREIVNNITDNYHDCNIDLNSYLKESGYAVDYIRNQFKKVTGKTPTELLTNVRISHACFMISTYKKAMSLYEIAEKCGFTDYVYFSKKFKSVTGVSPRKYKKT